MRIFHNERQRHSSSLDREVWTKDTTLVAPAPICLRKLHAGSNILLTIPITEKALGFKDIKGLKSTYNLSSGGKIAATKEAVHCIHFLPIFKALEQKNRHYWPTGTTSNLKCITEQLSGKCYHYGRLTQPNNLELQPSTSRQKHGKGKVVEFEAYGKSNNPFLLQSTVKLLRKWLLVWIFPVIKTEKKILPFNSHFLQVHELYVPRCVLTRLLTKYMARNGC